MRRPAMVGVLASAVVALVASAAMAIGVIGGPSSRLWVRPATARAKASGGT